YSLLEKLQKLNVESPVLMISSTEGTSAMGTALSRGAAGFVSKTSDSRVLLTAIKTVLGGDIYMPYQEPQNKSSQIKVTTRQQEVLLLLSQGLLNKQIAHELCISANTVKAHLHDIFRILDASNRTAAVQSAYKQGLL
ncbi:MAG TPA: response regulator transcription factor, partial [Leucothrix mucor]|nr:response regulator transcription factor [Leucothrix mucor]